MLLIFQAYTIAIGIIPITTLTLLKQNYLKRRNIVEAETISSSLVPHDSDASDTKSIFLESDNQKELLQIPLHDLLFIKSDGNYIMVGYLDKGKFSRKLLRNTLKYAEDSLRNIPVVFKCHRSWLVNMNRISGITGNSQGLLLKIEGFDEEIPVARSNAAGFRERITGRLV